MIRKYDLNIIMRFFTSTKSWRSYNFTAVWLQFDCVSVCLSAGLGLWTKFQPNAWTDLEAVFAKWLPHSLELNWNLWPWVKGHQRSQRSNNSLLISLLCMSALLCPINIKFILSLWYALGIFMFEFDKIWMGDDVIVTSFKFSVNNCPYSNSIEPTNFILGINVQLHKVHLLIWVKVTMT